MTQPSRLPWLQQASIARHLMMMTTIILEKPLDVHAMVHPMPSYTNAVPAQVLPRAPSQAQAVLPLPSLTLYLYTTIMIPMILIHTPIISFPLAQKMAMYHHLLQVPSLPVHTAIDLTAIPWAKMSLAIPHNTAAEATSLYCHLTIATHFHLLQPV